MEVQDNYSRVLAFVRAWDSRTLDVLLGSLRKQQVGDTEELAKSVRTLIETLGDGNIRWQLFFQTVGRFVDMGSGRGVKMGRRTRATPGVDDYGLAFRERRTKKKQRKPKKWYSRPVYGRLNALMGAVAATMAEMAVNGVRTIDSKYVGSGDRRKFE